MTRWVTFAAITFAVLIALLFFARASQSALDEGLLDATETDDEWRFDAPDGAGHLDGIEATPTGAQPDRTVDISTLSLLLNVGFSHGLFAVILAGAIWWTDVPLSALGITDDPLSTGWLAVVAGLALGAAIALANTLATGLADVFETDPSEQLRALLTPETFQGWVVLLLVVLPIIAGFEELLFRAALIGALSVGFELSPWLLAVLSSVAFAAGHGAQGTLGIVVTGLLGFVLAVAFVLTDSLLVVFVAHYVINAVEFVVIEGLGWEPFG